MISYDQKTLTTKQQHKFITASVIPRPIGWMTTLNEKGVVNVAPFSYFTVASDVMPLLTVSILRKAGKLKDTARNLYQQKQAVVHIVSEDLVTEMNKTSASLLPHESEIALTNLTLLKSRSVDVPRIKEAKVQFETVLHQSFEIKDNEGNIVTDVFVLKVVYFHFDEQVIDIDKGYVLANELKPVARLSGNQYTGLGSIFTLERPE